MVRVPVFCAREPRRCWVGMGCRGGRIVRGPAQGGPHAGQAEQRFKFGCRLTTRLPFISDDDYSRLESRKAWGPRRVRRRWVLNDWSDRMPEAKPRRRWQRVEFWVGVYVLIAFAGLVLNLVQFVRSLF